MALTGVLDLNKRILLQLSDEDLFNACLVNKDIAYICSDDDFWRLKVMDRYPEAVKFKDVDHKWKDYYIALIDAENNIAWREDYEDVEGYGIEGATVEEYINGDLVYNGYLDILKWVDSKGYEFNEAAANTAEIYNYQDILDWLASKGIYPEDDEE